MKTKDISRFLSLILRHEPETVGVTMDKNGWVSVSELLEKANLTQAQLDAVFELQARPDDKKRFMLNEDGTHIRAKQGHNNRLGLDLQFDEVEPPHILYHGTATVRVCSIMETGINRGERHHVHMSQSTSTANEVGMRNGTAVILEIDAYNMYKDGYKFYRSENGVWLTDNVPVKYIIDKTKNE
jgi:putative RNA 2'-phosphotransferase